MIEKFQPKKKSNLLKYMKKKKNEEYFILFRKKKKTKRMSLWLSVLVFICYFIFLYIEYILYFIFTFNLLVTIILSIFFILHYWIYAYTLWCMVTLKPNSSLKNLIYNFIYTICIYVYLFFKKIFTHSFRVSYLSLR